MPKKVKFDYSKSLSFLNDNTRRTSRDIKMKFTKKYGKRGVKYCEYAKRAYTKKLQFYLTITDFIALDTMNCQYCGGIPTGYDRINSKIGYIRSNIVPCCPLCNMMKYTSSYEGFINHVKKIYKYNFNKR